MAGKFIQLGPPMMFTSLPQVSGYMQRLWRRLGNGDGPLPVNGYAKAAMPDAAKWASIGTDKFTSLIFITDDLGGPVLAFSDGTNWRRVTDRAVIS